MSTSPFDQDTAALALAEAAGLEYVRLAERVVIDDAARLPLQYQRRQPDKAAIRKALLAGEQVPGAHLEKPGWLLIPKKDVAASHAAWIETIPKRKEERSDSVVTPPAPDVPHSPGAGE